MAKLMIWIRKMKFLLVFFSLFWVFASFPNLVHAEGESGYPPVKELYEKADDYFGIGEYHTAVKFYRTAARQGHAPSQYELAKHYDQGLGVARDREKADQLYRKAAEQGYAQAQHLMGSRYFSGYRVPQDDVLAHKWLNLAFSQGVSEARDLLDLVLKDMSQAQIAEAQKLARQWEPK